MAKSLRISVVVTAPQLEWLKAEAARLDLSIGEYLRRVLDEKRGVG